MLPVRIFLMAASMIGTTLLPAQEEFVVVKGNKITVQADTSLGGINCAYSGSTQKDTLFLNRQIPKAERIKFAIPVDKFNCGNKILNKDFSNTLNAKQYPYTQIEVVCLKKQGKDYKGTIKLELAGRTISLHDVQFNSYTYQGSETMKGSICLNFSEIGLATPSKLGGLFKVEDELQIVVELQIDSRPQKATSNRVASSL